MTARNVLLGTLAALTMTISITALASTVTIVDYNLSHPTGKLGHSHVYGAPGRELTISGYRTNIMPDFLAGTWDIGRHHNATNLYGKYKPNEPGETGLGMNSDPNKNEHEIWDYPGSHYQFGFLVMDLSHLEANTSLRDFQLGIQSAQAPNELYTVWGSTYSDPWSATLLDTGVGGQHGESGLFSVPDFYRYRYIWVGAEIKPGSDANHSDVLVDSVLTFNNAPPPPVPEPSTFALLGSGLLSAGFSLRKRFGKR
ncbi:MAG: PEP-CTERM sorting domain-containing protein [Acidobacteriaceae bacterium]